MTWMRGTSPRMTIISAALVFGELGAAILVIRNQFSALAPGSAMRLRYPVCGTIGCGVGIPPQGYLIRRLAERPGWPAAARRETEQNPDPDSPDIVGVHAPVLVDYFVNAAPDALPRAFAILRPRRILRPFPLRSSEN